MNGYERAIRVMTGRIVKVLKDPNPTIYLYGSLVLNDFKPGWSDIDILVLTRQSIGEPEASQLLGLRQTMQAEEPENPYYRSFEGAMLSLDGFLEQTADTVICWGTSGQRLTNRYALDSFCMAELLEYGILLWGEDVRARFSAPSLEQLRADVQTHYEAIRRCAGDPGRSMYSFGWLLDISRCLYTLRTGTVIAKTAAAEWALEEGLCPVPKALEKALSIRKEPLRYRACDEMLDSAQSLGPDIQRYADVLEKALCAEGSGAEKHL